MRFAPLALALVIWTISSVNVYGQGPISVPGKIKVEQYDSFYDTTPGNSDGGCRVDDVDLVTSDSDQPDPPTNCLLTSTRTGEWIGFTIVVSETDTYVLSIRVRPYSSDVAGGGTFHVEIDGVDVSGTMRVPYIGGFPGGWWTTMFKHGIALTAGQHTLRLKMDSESPTTGRVGRFNYLALTKTVPFGAVPFALPGLVQTEDFDRHPSGSSGETFAYHDFTAANDGNAPFYRPGEAVDVYDYDEPGYYIDMTTGEWLAYTVDVTEPGPWTIGLRVAHPGPGGTLHFEIDGKDVTGPIAIPDTGGWGHWQTITIRGVPLPMGLHVLYLVADSESAITGTTADIDYVTFADPPPAPGCNPLRTYTAAAINNCLSQGDTVLEDGAVYTIDETVRIQLDDTMLTGQGSGNRPVLRATSALQVPMIEAPDRSRYTIANITVDGNRAQRAPNANCSGDRKHNYYNLKLIGGSGWKVHHIESSNAVCASAMVAQGAGLDIYSNSFKNNGQHASSDQDPLELWADGLTLLKCEANSFVHSFVHDNDFVDNTDVGLIVGGGSGCYVERNTISNRPASEGGRRAFAGMHIGWFPPGQGNHQGSFYRTNTISSALNQMAFGLIVGAEPWWDAACAAADSTKKCFVSDAGTVTGNTITGAVVNLAIDGIGVGSVTGNQPSGAQGSNGKGGGCQNSPLLPKNYTVHFSLGANIDTNYDPMFFFEDRCDQYTRGTEPGLQDSLLHDYELVWQSQSPEVYLYAKDNSHRLVYQGDSNLVVQRFNTQTGTWVPIWSGFEHGVPRHSPGKAVMQADGNFVLYPAGCNYDPLCAAWSTHTEGNRGSYVVIQSDGNLVVYSIYGTFLWDSFTAP